MCKVRDDGGTKPIPVRGRISNVKLGENKSNQKQIPPK